MQVNHADQLGMSSLYQADCPSQSPGSLLGSGVDRVVGRADSNRRASQRAVFHAQTSRNDSDFESVRSDAK